MVAVLPSRQTTRVPSAQNNVEDLNIPRVPCAEYTNMLTKQEPKSKKTRVDAGAPFWERPATRWYAGMHDTCKVKRWEKLRNRLLADETPISPDLGPPWEVGDDMCDLLRYFSFVYT